MKTQHLQQPAARDPIASFRWIAVCGLLAFAVANGIGRFAFTPILPMMQADTDLTVAQGGLLASANYLGYLVGALWATVHRVAALRALRIAFLVTAAATIAMGLTEGLLVWCALRLAAGIASAWVVILSTSWCLERLAPLRRPLLNGAVFAGVGVGIFVAGLVCLALMGMGGGSRSAWIALGTLALVVTAAVWPVLGVDAGVRGPATGVQDRFRWSAEAMRLVFCYGAFGLGYIIPGTFIPVMAREIVQDPFVFGWAWPVFGTAAAASTLLAVPRTPGSHRSLWRGAAVLMAVGVVSPLVLPGMPGVLLAAVLVGGTFMVVTMAGMQEAHRVAGRHAAVLIAAMTSAFAAGQIAGPILVSLLVQRSGGFGPALWVGFALLLTSAVLLRDEVAPAAPAGAPPAPFAKSAVPIEDEAP